MVAYDLPVSRFVRKLRVDAPTAAPGSVERRGGRGIVGESSEGDAMPLRGARSCKGLTGDLGPLQGLTQLMHLDLSYCKGLTGDLGPLKGLAQLTHLHLGSCKGLTGDLGPLQGLTKLTHLNLEECNKLTGDKKGLMEAARRRRA